jgi:NADH:ubiquinone oxidoreductase subunit 6 (subunit J)
MPVLLIIAAVFVGVACLFLLPVVLVALIFGAVAFVFVFWIWMLVDAIKNRGIGDGEKVGWVLAIVFLHVVGSLLYFFIGRPRRLTPLAGT